MELTPPAAALPTEYAAYIGIDWADRKHDICLYDPTLGEYERSVIVHTPEAIKAWVESLQQRFPGQRIAGASLSAYSRSFGFSADFGEALSSNYKFGI